MSEVYWPDRSPTARTAPVGTRVRIVRWSVSPGSPYDDNAVVPPGTLGTVTLLDRLNFAVKWDNGHNLSVLEEDEWELA